MNRPVIVCCPTRNELHNLSRLVAAWDLYADRIIIADQMSTDGSRKFLANNPKVILKDNGDNELNETNRIKLLLETARSISDSSVLLFLDADETLSANILTSLEWKTFAKSDAGTTGYFRWVNLWGSRQRYIARGPAGAPAHRPFAFIDDGRPLDGTGVMHGPRGPGMDRPERRFYFNDVVNLHFFLSNRNVYQKKQNWYKYYWISRGGKCFHTNRNHVVYDKVDMDKTEACPTEWFMGFTDNGIDLSSVWNPELLWYDVEILQYMNKEGARALWLADIWNQDWEHLRLLAKKAGHANIPDAPIEPPPAWVRRFHDWTLGRETFASARRSLRRYFVRTLLP